MAERKPRMTIESGAEAAERVEPAEERAEFVVEEAAAGEGPQEEPIEVEATPREREHPIAAADAWVERTFPGHRNAFWGGVAGLVVALLVFAIGILRTLLIALLVVAGVAVGQVADGDPRILNALRALWNSRD